VGNQVELLSWNERRNDWGSDGKFPFTTTAEIGKCPLELFDPVKEYNDEVWYRGNHPGSQIISIDTIDSPTQPTDDSQKNAERTDDPKGKTGGIDLRSLPIITQTMQPGLGIVPGDIQGQSPVVSDVNALRGTVPAFNPELDKELFDIQRMIEGGIIPSCQRLKEFLEASCTSADCKVRMQKILSCIADILRLEEERVCQTAPELKQMLVLLESNQAAGELQAALRQIEVAAQ
jgi:hypothetical protein